MEDEYPRIIYKASKIDRIRKRVRWGVKKTLCKLGIHNFEKTNCYHVYGNYIWYGRECKWCYKEKEQL